MKNLVYVMAVLMTIGCGTGNKEDKMKSGLRPDTLIGGKNAIVKVFGAGKDLYIPIDEFMQMKDSFRFCEDEYIWMTKELYWFNYECPDTIMVKSVLRGDSIIAVRRSLLADSTGKYYSPAYFEDNRYWEGVPVYDVNGNYKGRFGKCKELGD